MSLSVNFSSVLQAARKENASDIHIIAGLAPAFRVNGEVILAQAEALSYEDCQNLIYSLINKKQREHFEKHKELCFSICDEVAGRLRITLYLRNGSPEMAIRMCVTQIPMADELNLPPIIDELARKAQGLVLITGPTGSGKTTTLNYMVDLINRERRCKIVTIEDPIEYVHIRKKSVIVQQELYTDCLNFAQALRNILRQDPDIIVIGEMRDLDTIETALTAAETGHLVLATLHTPNVSQTVERIIGVFPPEHQQTVILQLANTLRGIIAQDLIPQVGEKKRALACETLIATSALQNIIRERHFHMVENVVTTGKREGMITMDQTLLQLYQQGKISYDAVMSRIRNRKIMEKYPEPYE